MKPWESKRKINRLLGLLMPYVPQSPFGHNRPRSRDNRPAWVKDEALEKAKQKRKMRADKLRKLSA